MQNGSRDLMLSWLRDAHAMEVGLANVLDAQSRHDLDSHIRARIRDHADLSWQQARRLELCLKHYGSDTSTVKDAFARVSGFIEGLATRVSSDTPVKDLLMGIASGHFEIACYRSLETAAEELHDTEVAAVAHQNRLEEHNFLRFLESQLEEVTRKELRKHECAVA
jgi:ferritin-like metal-binding protein YciE